jgi:hypothetical protein
MRNARRTRRRWSRIHHSLIAARSIMIAWFLTTFRIAGTTLNYEGRSRGNFASELLRACPVIGRAEESKGA